jgi:hypothetical protein
MALMTAVSPSLHMHCQASHGLINNIMQVGVFIAFFAEVVWWNNLLPSVNGGVIK